MREPTTSTLSSSGSVPREFPPTARKPSGPLYALTVFLSAFLLFQVQPLAAKEILPWFGGSAGVWTTCMLFFQLALLAGYYYAHVIASVRSPRRAGWVHMAALGLAIAALPIIPSDWWKPLDGSLPVWRILGLLTATVGMPYFLLASTSPLLQTWYARASGSGVPYRLFALSNLGSMLALLSYPVLIEPRIPLRLQAWIWSGGFAVFAVLCGWLAWASRRLDFPLSGESRAERETAPGWTDRWMWLLLAACPSGLLLAITNHLTQNIAAIPFLWVLPLSLYLLSFILTFESSRWYHRRVFLGLFAVSAASMGYAVASPLQITNLRVLLPLFTLGLFICCMVCHGELASRKPPPGSLTSFYLMISLGGAAGGLFVAALAPAVFPALFELPILLVATPALILAVIAYDHKRAPRPATEWARVQFWPAWVFSAACTLVFAGYIAEREHYFLGGAHLLVRNFYGALRVTDNLDLGTRELAHGTINHGEQFLDPVRRRTPLTYYWSQTGIGLLMTDLQKRGPMRVGVVGLGTGSMAAWSRAGDTFRFYEINPLVLGIARSEFTFLKDSRAAIEVVLGDARLSLEREPSGQFDVLVVDAFSGDSIPIHLLTREAFQLYWRHLRPQGVLAVHVSNHYLKLAPPVRALAGAFQREAHLIESEQDTDTSTRRFASDWVLVGSDEKRRFPWMDTEESDIDGIRGLHLWTDDFSNLWQILQ